MIKGKLAETIGGSMDTWISVNDETPVIGVFVMTYGRYGNQIATYKGNGWVAKGMRYALEPEKITHWMKLPKAPPFE